MANHISDESWKIHVSQWKKSGLSQNKYCRENRITPSMFSKWKQKLKSADDFKSTSFVQVAVGNSTFSVSPMKLVLNDKYSIEITPGFDKKLLSDLLQVLEA